MNQRQVQTSCPLFSFYSSSGSITAPVHTLKFPKSKPWCCPDTWLRRGNQKPRISLCILCHSTCTQPHILPVVRSWNLSLVFFFLHFHGLNNFPSDDSLPRCCRDAGAFWVLLALSTTTSQLARDDDFSSPSTTRHKKGESAPQCDTWFILTTVAFFLGKYCKDLSQSQKVKTPLIWTAHCSQTYAHVWPPFLQVTSTRCSKQKQSTQQSFICVAPENWLFYCNRLTHLALHQ